MKKIEEIAMEYALPQSKYKLAKERYEKLQSLLDESGIECRIYPQGSFSYGAITKPYKDGKDATYDIDVIVEFPNTDDSYPGELMNQIETLLKSDKYYADKVSKHENGFTINYPGDFRMDVIPAKQEDSFLKMKIREKSKEPLFTNDSIKIPKFVNERYSYLKNNPLGFKMWFKSINDLSISKEYVTSSKRELLNESFRGMYFSAEDIPNDYVVTPLQKVIILLKRCRDVYYSRTKIYNKPLSGMLCLLACNAVKNNYFLSFDETLRVVINHILSLENGKNLDSLHLDNNKWVLINPTNCFDDLADNWSDSLKDGKAFFDFIRKIKNDLIPIKINDSLNESVIHNAFGKTIDSYANVANTGKSWKR